MANPILDDEDEDQVDGQPTTDNVDYLSKLVKAANGDQSDADARSERLAGVAKDIGDEQRRNAFAASLMQSAGQVGTLGGKTPSAAPVAGMAQGLDQAAQGQYGDMLRASDRADKRAGMNAKVLQYLSTQAGKKHFAPAGVDQDGNALVIDQATGNITPSGVKAQKLPGAPKPPAPPRFQNVGTDADGNVLVMDQTTGQVTSTGVKGQKMGGPAKPDKGDADERNFAMKYRPQVGQDKDLKDATGTVSAINEALPLIDDATKNAGSANALGPVLARVLSHGQRINMPEIESMEGGSKAVFDRLQTLTQRAEAGTITQPQAAALKQMLSVMSKGAAKIKDEREQAHLDAYTSLSPTGVDEDTARTYLGFKRQGGQIPAAPVATGAPDTGPGTAQAAPAGTVTPSLTDIQAEIARRGLKKPGGGSGGASGGY